MAVPATLAAAVWVAWTDLGTGRLVTRHLGALVAHPGTTLLGADLPGGPWGRVESTSRVALVLHATPEQSDSRPWFLDYLVDEVPEGGSFTFADIGVVGYALNGADLWDLRGLTWPGATALLNAPRGDAGATAALAAELGQAPPDLLALTCAQGRPSGRVEMALSESGFLDQGYYYVGADAYFAPAGLDLCVYRRIGSRAPPAAVVAARRARLAREMPHLFGE